MASSPPGESSNLRKTSLYKDIKPNQWPIIYSTQYNIGFLYLERLHPFDSSKWGSIINFLRESGMITNDTIVTPNTATKDDLLVVHTERYLSSLKWSINVARVLEVPPVAFLPNFLVQRRVLRPLRCQTGGTILAGKLALERGWSINVGGGFHHCSSDTGGGFCAYADLTLLIHNLFLHYSDRVKKVLIVDLDAHQGNGHERDFLNDERVFIMDMYNRQIYPRDHQAKQGIRCRIELENYTNDKTYLRLLHINLEKSLNEFQPDFVVFNAGTDILQGDPLGLLDITPEGVIIRDEIVFSKCIRDRHLPLVMCTSGGYQRTNARVIADSILNLHRKKLISCYEELKNTVTKYGDDKRIFVLFSGTKDAEGHSWCPDCVVAEKPVQETVKSSLPSNGVFIECSVGDRPSWKDPNCSFRTDPQLRLTNIPTLIEWGTSKRLTEGQLLDKGMIEILFEED